LDNYDFSIKSVYKNSVINEEKIMEHYIGSNNESIVSSNSEKDKGKSNSSNDSQQNS
jgi:hypothetical protein